MASFYDAWDDKPAKPPGNVHPIRPTPDGNVPPYAQAALTAEVERVATAANGTRNDTLNRATFSLAQLVAGGALDEQTVREHLTAAAFTCGLEQREIDATIDSGFRGGSQHPRGIPDTPPPDLEVPAVTVLEQQAGGDPAAFADKIRERFPIIDWHELWTRESAEEWIIEPLLPARRLIALYSPPKVGKSLLMLELAVAIARGSEAFGTKMERPRRVLYVDFENDPEGDIRPRLIDMGHSPDVLANLCYLPFPSMAYLDTENGSLELLAAADVYDCEVIVIDTVSRSVGGDENENDTWLNFYRYTGLKLKQAQKSLIRLDHTGKDETKGQRGGSAKVGDVDAVWKMSRVTETTYRLDCEAHRFPLAEKTLVVHRLTDPLRHQVEPRGKSAVWEARVEEYQATLDDARAAADISNAQARELLRSAGVAVSNDLLAEVLRRRKLTVLPFRGTPGTADEIATIDTSAERLRNGDQP